MKKISLIVISVFIFTALQSQNLIPNPSFEESCEEFSLGNGNFGARYWYNANAGTFDYYTNAGDAGNCGDSEVNSSTWQDFNEYQVPQEGSRMVGGIMYCNSFCIREMIQCKLLQPLEADRPYCFSMYVCMSGMYDFTCNGVGMALSNDSLTDYSHPCNIDLELLIQYPDGAVLNDTMNWYFLSGNFIANGGERYLTLGNHRSDAQTTIGGFNGSTNLPYSYYYFDNLVLEQCTETATLNLYETSISVFPNPTSDKWRINGVDSFALWEVYDLSGRLVLTGVGREVESTGLQAGAYFLKLGDRNIKLIKQ
ncbi:MAG: T9SS type A sorting domain-containing protein [Flavobacteriales bacterium]